jgi:glutathione synthase/RimK-type ligase-like ATP-grasp enzyme
MILLITHSRDYFTIDKVSEALIKRGVQPFRLDTDRFPITVKMAANLNHLGYSYELRYDDRSIAAEQVQAVWMRRIWQPQIDEDLATQFRDACVTESLAALDGFWDSLQDVYWLDNLDRIKIAESKFNQLRIAREIGLTIPQTLVTNDIEEARNFFHQLEGRMVARLLSPLSYINSQESVSFFLYANRIREEDLLETNLPSYCPIIFQEDILTYQELRVVFVDGNLYTGASTLDRQNNRTEVWQTHQLPDRISHRLIALNERLGLKFSTLNLIKTPSEEYVFLELNPTGEWGMLERDLGYPIADAIANVLVENM